MKSNTIYKIFLLAVLIIISIIYLYSVLSSMQPNVILITVDALRPDHLSCYGYQRITSPNIDKLAHEGAIFSQAISTATWTPPSLCSILTSRYPYVFSLFEVSKDWGDISTNTIDNLPQILRHNNYKTCLITSHYGMNQIIGLKQNFNTFNCWITDRDDNITSSAIKWLKENHNKPFFLWVHYMGPHAPYLPPFPYDMLYRDENNLNQRKVALESIPQYAALDENTDIDYYISQYDGEIAFTDEQIGILLRDIKRLNLYKKTILILTADHGESMGEHNCYFNHGCNLYDVMLKIPLIIVYKKVIPKCRIIKEQVSLIDIMPTVLDILKIKINSKINGISLLPLMSGLKTVYNKYTFSERFFGQERQVAVRTTGWKLIYNSFSYKYELYNLKKDPKEMNNIVLTEHRQFKLLKKRLDDYLKEMALLAKTSRTLNRATEERLKNLGYLQ